MIRVLKLVVAGLLLIEALPASAIVEGRISDPEWFSGVRNKLLVLEYDNVISGPAGAQLADSIGRLALATISGLDGFAVITLRQAERPAVLTRATIEELAQRQRAPVVIWGELYESKGQLFITSHVRWVPNIVTNKKNLEFAWQARRGAMGGRAVATLPTSQVNFAPIRITSQTLSQIGESWQRAIVLREKPDERAAPSGELTPDRPYYVTATAKEWTQLKVKDGGAGWTRLTEMSGHPELRRLQGAVLYAQGMMQYMAGNLHASRTSFEQYLDEFGSAEDPMNRAVAHLMSGYARFATDSTEAGISNATAHFEKARMLLPNTAAPVNCLALVLFRNMANTNATRSEVGEMEKHLIRAVETEEDLDAVRNLQMLYQAPRAHEYFSLSESRFTAGQEKRTEVLRSLERKLTNR